MCGRRMWRSRWYQQLPVCAPEDYTYIGPCRCGTGPHAFYQDKSGRIVPAWQIYRWGIPEPTKEELKAELEALKDEKAQLEKRIVQLEKHIEEMKK